jgi:hypothetical protein
MFSGDLGLSLTGMRIGPRDPATHAPKVGTKLEVIRPETSGNVYQPRMMKVNNVSLKVLGTFWLLWRFQDP